VKAGLLTLNRVYGVLKSAAIGSGAIAFYFDSLPVFISLLFFLADTAPLPVKVISQSIP
jgi:hypothetical protein